MLGAIGGRTAVLVSMALVAAIFTVTAMPAAAATAAPATAASAIAFAIARAAALRAMMAALMLTLLFTVSVVLLGVVTLAEGLRDRRVAILVLMMFGRICAGLVHRLRRVTHLTVAPIATSAASTTPPPATTLTAVVFGFGGRGVSVSLRF